MNAVSEAYLVLPPAGDRTVANLQAQVRKIALKRLLSHPTRGLTAPLARALAAVRPVLTQLARTQPRVLAWALAQPDVLTPLLVLDVGEAITGTRDEDNVRAALLALLVTLAHQARAGALPEAILLDLPIDVLADPVGHRRLRLDPPARGLLADPLGLELNLHDETKLRLPAAPAGPDAHASVTLDRPFHPLHPELPGLQFALYDSNPLSMFEAHPDKFGNAISLGEKSLEHWRGAFHDALELVRLALPTWFEELKSSMRRFVPVGYLPERHLSASYREAPGVAYLTLCDDPLTIAEAIVHETQHSKANLLSWVDPVVHNAHTTWTKSPVRPDLRPLWGVLLAVHAFVPVAALHANLAALDHPATHTERFPRRRAEVLAGNHRGMLAVLEHSDPSHLGRRLIDEMSRLHDHLRATAPPPPAGLDLPDDVLPPG